MYCFQNFGVWESLCCSFGSMFWVIACWKISGLLQTATYFLLGMPHIWLPSTLPVSQPLLMKNISTVLWYYHRGSLWWLCSETCRSLPYIGPSVSTNIFYFIFKSREPFPHICCHQLEFHRIFSRDVFLLLHFQKTHLWEASRLC